MPKVMEENKSKTNISIPMDKLIKKSNSELNILNQPNQIEEKASSSSSPRASSPEKSEDSQILKIQKKKQDLLYEGEESEEEDEVEKEEDEEEMNINIQPKNDYFG